MPPLALFYYCGVGSCSLLVNLFIIYASIRVVRGEFKWVFLGSAATNVLLSVSQILLMPGAIHWPDSKITVVVSSNPLMADHQFLCSQLYEFLYFRQLEASVLCICLVPLNRAFAICWRSITPRNAKIWAVIAVIPNVIPFLVLLIARQFPGTSYHDIEDFPVEAMNELRKKDIIVCTLTSHFSKLRDVLHTIFFLLCPLISYPVVIFCVFKLVVFVWRSQRSIRANVSPLVIQRQKGILITICIQAIAPLLFFSPLFVNMMLSDREELHPNEWFPDHSAHLLTAICPLVDALATVFCLKPFRKALHFCGTSTSPISIFNLERRPSTTNARRPPSRGDDRLDMVLPGSTEIIETRV